ncbi:MAG: protein kinase [Isosphaeraceae bacterium]
MSESGYRPADEPSSGDDATLADRVADLVDRLRRGEGIDLEADGSPQAAELRRLLPTLRLMSELGDPPAPGPEMGSLGDFRILRELGRGGMGIVYEAIQVSLGRRVALKMLPSAATLDPRQLQRFRIEAQSAASLHHPGIVPVFALGSERGIPFYAMQLIDGRDVSRVIEGWAKGTEPASGRDRERFRTVARLGRQAAEALAYAHEHHVLHRDIKPSNLLVDEAGHLWITDFGLARIRGDLDLTRTGDNIGTPRYMSPEQALGGRAPLDGRADIYSLGVTLYELATLRPAFVGHDRIQILRQIAEAGPARPRRIDATIPVDLETIILKAMARAPSDRYASATELADDLGRFLAGESIRARQPWVGRRLREWARRRPAAATGLLALAALAGVLGWAEARRRYHETLLVSAQGAADDSRRAVEESAGRLRRVEAIQQLRAAAEHLRENHIETARELIRGLAAEPDGFRAGEFAWGLVQTMAREALRPVGGEGEAGEFAVPSRDWRYLASFDLGGPIHLIDGATLRHVTSIPVPGPLQPPQPNSQVEFSPEGHRLLAIESDSVPGAKRRAWIWEVPTGRLLAEVHPPPGRWLRWVYLVGGGRFYCETSPLRGNSVRSDLWDLSGDDREPRWIARLADDYNWGARSRDGRLFAAVDSDRIVVVDAVTGALRQTLGEGTREGMEWRLEFAADSRTLMARSPTRVEFWDLTRGALAESRALARGATLDRVWTSPDGYTLIFGNIAGKIESWHRQTGQKRGLRADALQGKHDFEGRFSDDGTRLMVRTRVAGGNWEFPRVWDYAKGRLVATTSWDHPVEHSSFSPDALQLVLSREPVAQVWRIEPLAPFALGGHKDEAWAVAFSRRGDLLASGGDDEGGDDPDTIKIWDPRDGRLVRAWAGGAGTASSLAFDPAGRTLASAHLDAAGSIRLWDVGTGSLLHTLGGHAGKARSVAFHPGGRWLASSSSDGTARLWDVVERGCLLVLEGHAGTVQEVAFDPSGTKLATAGSDGTLRLWEIPSGRAVRVMKGGKFTSLAFSPDGSLLAAADEGGRVTLWDPGSGALRGTLPCGTFALYCVAFTPGGEALAVAGTSGRIQLWDIRTGLEIVTLQVEGSQVHGLAISPDGSALVSASHDGAVSLWRVGPPDRP